MGRMIRYGAWEVLREKVGSARTPRGLLCDGRVGIWGHAHLGKRLP